MTSDQINWPAGSSSQHGSPSPSEPKSSISSRVTQSVPMGTGKERPVTFWSILDAFRRRWIPAVAIAIPAALLVAGLLWQAIPAQYESVALLQVKQFQGVLLGDTKEKQSDFINYRNSQINLIKSRKVMATAARTEGLKDSRTLTAVKYATEFLQERVEVDEDLSDEFIRISMDGEYPEDIAAIVNAVVDAYMETHFYASREEKVDRLNKLKSKFKSIDETVRKNQDRLDNLAEQLGTGDAKALTFSQQNLQAELRGYMADLRELNAEIRQEESYRQYLKEQGLSEAQIERQLSAPATRLGTDSSSLVNSSSREDELLLQYKKRLLETRRQIDAFERNVRSKRHPQLLALKKLEQRLVKVIRDADGPADAAVAGARNPRLPVSRYAALKRQREKLDFEIETIKGQIALLGERGIELERERKDTQHLVGTRDEMRDTITAQEIELERPNRVEIVQEANVPQKRNIKKRAQLATVGGLATLGLILAGFTMYEWFSHRVGSTSDIANAVNLRLVGTIPSPDRGGLLGLGIFAGKVDYDEWNRAVIESMDVVRTYLMRHIDPSRPASILLTSASANEGKTTVSCQLAASLARSGKRVAIVDCDFRRPSAHLLMDGEAGPGICEFLRGEVPLKDICQETQAHGLTFIPAGAVDQEVLQKLTVDGGQSMIRSLKAQFDFVVIDTSPLLFVAEPSILAQNADIVLLSTRKDYSRIPYVSQSRDSLRSLQVPLVGAVMVGADSDFQRQSYGYRQEIQKKVKQDQMAGAGA